MNLLICINTLTTGGAEIFAIRLANEMAKTGVNVTLFNFRGDKTELSIKRSINSGINFVHARIISNFLIEKIDGLFFKLGFSFSLQSYFIRNHLEKIIKKNKIEVVHGHLITVDKITIQLKKKFPNLKLISTAHGDYQANFLRMFKGEFIYRERDFDRTTLSIFSKLDHLVCITDKQVQTFTEFAKKKKIDINLLKIYNGYPPNKPKGTHSLSELGINKADFVFGLVSRGIPEKGWEIAIEAFLKLNYNNAHLILVGESDYLKKLSQNYSIFHRIYFVGYSANVLEYINLFDVGLLPTQIVTESLPTVIIEYLLCACPVIATDCGEISNMIKTSDGNAGILIPPVERADFVTELSVAMRRMYSDSEFRSVCSKRAEEAYKKFDLDVCIRAYKNLYF